MDELNNNINEYFTKGRALAESLTLKGRADLDSLRRKTADAAKQLMRLKDRSPIERKLTDERYAVLERARSACGALKNAKRTRCASGAPLVLLFAREYLRECAWRAESDSLEAYLSGFQCIHPLEYGELWLLSEVFAALIPCAFHTLHLKSAK